MRYLVRNLVMSGCSDLIGLADTLERAEQIRDELKTDKLVLAVWDSEDRKWIDL